ncbi:hypothetical protein PVL29_007050 [Vitis rotundifolia]|uniref:Rieske domain-containing protein n=1 Tax=Vitis rotundifolia TaxID=103349 RepID=A0AA38ZYM7_VITRO|nr:hypothetical protein PVL29_007050 [Vitis rotundifolia]
MEVLRAPSFPSFHLSVLPTRFHIRSYDKPLLHVPFNPLPNSSVSSIYGNFSKSKPCTARSSASSSEAMDLPRPSHHGEEKFDWFSQWYPVAPVCDLDKRKPHSKRVIGLDVVVWWDRNESEWKVFDDACAHRLAPLSEGRIDQWGRLQCVYHGWCFNGRYEILMENVMDPAHVANAHYGIMQIPQAKDINREGGTPIEISVKRSAIDGFDAERELARSKFIPPCLYYTCLDFPSYQSNESVSSGLTKEEPSSHMSPKRALLILICVPVSPGNSRLIWTFPRNFGLWTDHIIPRWMLHIGGLISGAGCSVYHGRCFNGSGDCKFIPQAPPESSGNAFDKVCRFTHIQESTCSSGSVAYIGLPVPEVVLQIVSIALIGIPAINHGAMSVAARTTLVFMAVICFVDSR